MILQFGRSAKLLRDAVNSGNEEELYRLYPEHAEKILNALNLLSQAANLNEVMPFKMFRPHVIASENIFSMTVGGRKRLIVRTLGKDGKPTKKIDFHTNYGLIVEVSEHYGD